MYLRSSAEQEKIWRKVRVEEGFQTCALAAHIWVFFGVQPWSIPLASPPPFSASCSSPLCIHFCNWDCFILSLQSFWTTEDETTTYWFCTYKSYFHLREAALKSLCYHLSLKCSWSPVADSFKAGLIQLQFSAFKLNINTLEVVPSVPCFRETFISVLGGQVLRLLCLPLSPII